MASGLRGGFVIQIRQWNFKSWWLAKYPWKMCGVYANAHTVPHSLVLSMKRDICNCTGQQGRYQILWSELGTERQAQCDTTWVESKMNDKTTITVESNVVFAKAGQEGR